MPTSGTRMSPYPRNSSRQPHSNDGSGMNSAPAFTSGSRAGSNSSGTTKRPSKIAGAFILYMARQTKPLVAKFGGLRGKLLEQFNQGIIGVAKVRA